ncbi:MAG: hypothetical protein P1V51_03080 [Deltaproteobacteria bacterium]|nr:hypothetical protein [Deltaproteobacteria bacterium]
MRDAYRSKALVLGLLAGLIGGGCSCEPDLKPWPEAEAKGTLSLVEAANPEGGAAPTADGSDLTVPPREGDLGWWVDLAAAPDGTLHLAYTDAFNGELHHAQAKKEGGWEITVVDAYGAVGKYPSIAVDGSGRPHLLYYNQDKSRLYYATRVGAEKIDSDDRRRPFQGHPDWLFEVVDDGEEVGMASQLRALPDGTVHALYYTAKEKLIHLARPAGAPGEHQHWKRRTVDEKAGGSHSIEVGFLQGPDGTLHASYANWTVFDSQLRYATLAPGAEAWQSETLVTPANAGWKSGLVLDAKGHPQIAYLTLRNRRLILATRAEGGEGWKHQHLVGSANTMALVGTAKGALHLPHEHLPGVGMADARLRLLTRPAGAGDEGWTLRNFGTRGAMASYLAATLLPDGRLAVAFYDGGVRGVKVWTEDAN